MTGRTEFIPLPPLERLKIVRCREPVPVKKTEPFAWFVGERKRMWRH